MSSLRGLLKDAASNQEGADLRACLYRSWCTSVGAVLSLCLLSQVTHWSQHLLEPCQLLLSH